MEIAKGVDQIQTSFGVRPLNLLLLRGEENVLVDTGLVGTPTKGIFPEMEKIGFSPENLTMVFVTHAHADHFGGNEEILRKTNGTARFLAHYLDQPFVEDPPRHTREGARRLVDLGLMSVEEVEEGVREAGNGVEVQVSLEEGETFDLGKGLRLEVHFLPGHTIGNVALLEKKTGTLFVGETVCGTAQCDVNGKPLMIVNYDDVDLYLKTLSRISRLEFMVAIFSHLKNKSRKETIEFAKESANLVKDFDREVKQRIQDAKSSVTTIEIWKTLDGLWGRYRADMAMYPLMETHLRSLLKRHVIEGSFEKGFQWIGDEEDYLSETCDEVVRQLPKV